MLSKPPDIAIVIPFFQKKKGLLRQCVESILSQAGDLDFHIIIVDDGSPIPADGELAGLIDHVEGRINLIRQPNAGPGAARNTGLDHVPEGTPFVTFLDSDDQWTGPFLADAIHILRQGYDLFVGNSARAGKTGTRFQWDADPYLNLASEEHDLLDADRQLYRFRGDFFDVLVRRSSLISTTTFAYRFEAFPHVRFDPTIYNGQDRLFKLMLGRNLQNIAFSPKVYAFEGEGLNIFDNSQWGSEGSVRLSASYIRLARTILNNIRLDTEQHAFVEGQLADARHALVANVLHLVRRRLPVDWNRVIAVFREDPMSALLLPTQLWRILLKQRRN
ncbi:glycosyl transferase [Ectothiorhodospira shaposhnikovii]|uniref:glycosyltransferase family 2 protein n=1 Tax=Ectothiorhodospira shaposhnikovii TaxID=1054 RepID=UPI001904BA01|nr:glycosyltransferase family 2 protein [Ectothiorhodospira shaposhnikovii]MBK1672747.1 glycosyl transferase [Ectothiorhodospira shaposhnikovii]